LRAADRGSEKIIGHYRLLLASAKTEKERERYRSRIEHEQRLLDQLRDGSRVTSREGEDRFAAFDIVVKRRGRSRWIWSVCTTGGRAVMCGSECSRGGARYKAERALFLLLCASASRLSELPLERPCPVRRTSGRSKNAPASEL
jgi:hypothetical protein